MLIVEDDASLRFALQQSFVSEGYLVTCATDGRDGLELALQSDVDLLILDLMLPGVGGLEILRKLRATKRTTPVIVLTARGEEHDRVAGFELGADDYVTKPFSVKELLLRAVAVLRRTGETSKESEDMPSGCAKNVIGEAFIDFAAYQIRRGDETMSLARKEADMLRLFLTFPNQVISRKRFLDEVWGYESFPTTRTVDTHILKLRQKIEQDPSNPRHIITVHGVGYKLLL